MDPDEFVLTIDAFGSHGEGIGRYEGYAVFVTGALPGETVKVRYVERHQRYARAELLEILTPSSERVKPVCPLFGRCGGCQLMHLTYEAQLEAKKQRVIDSLQRIGKLTAINVLPCAPSPSSLHYRNKMQHPAKQGKEGIVLGLYAHASHDLVEIDTCYIHCEMGNTIYRDAAMLLHRSKLTAYEPEKEKGEFRHLLIKSAVHTRQALVIFVVTQDSKKLLMPIAEELCALHKEIKGVIQNINPNSGNVILGDRYEVLRGVESIEETLGHLTFKISPASFFQVNPDQALHLYTKALEFAGLTGTETVLDAYCGVGTLALFFAKGAKKIIGVECVAAAIENAKENAVLNSIKNAEFICSDAEKYLSSCKTADIVLLNPPRKGCSPGVLKEIQRLHPKKVIYISCDPGTLARDLAVLTQGKYHVDAIQPFDMFPQTAHVETVVSLSL